MNTLYNLARVTTATTGTGTITLGSAVSGFLTFAQAGVPDGATVSYGISDGANSEVGYGIYTASGTTLTRNVRRSTGAGNTAAISLSGSAQVFITAAAEDMFAATVFEQDYGLPVPAIDMDFTTALYWNAPNNPGNPLTFTRASTAYITSDATDAGTWSSVASGTLRRNTKGALIEEARTNSLRNNSMQGIAAGSPGTLPTNWVASVPTGLTRTISTGSTGGVEWIDVNWTGTTTSTAAIQLVTETTTGIATVAGEIWANSAWVSNTANTGVSSVTLNQVNLNSGGSNINTNAIASGLLSASWARVGGTLTVSGGTVADTRMVLATNSITSGTVVNYTVRLGWPQMEKVTDSTFTYSSPIRTTGAAATRAADVLDVNLPTAFGTSYTLRARGFPNYATGYNADQYALVVSDGTTSNRFALLRLAATAIPQWIINSTKTAIGATAWAIATSKRLAAANAVSSQAGSFDGAAATTGSSATSPTGLTKVSIGHDGTGAGQWNGWIERVMVWPGVRLGNQAVASITAANIGGTGYVTALDYGTTTNDDAVAGHVGEFQSSVILVANVVALTTATPANITSLSLTAGDWEVDGEVWFNPAGTTVASQQIAAINTTSATLPTTPSTASSMTKHSGTAATGVGDVLPVGPCRLSLSTTTTVYLVAQSTFVTSTNGAYGELRARRLR